MITGSILRIYSDKFCQNLHETVTVSGSDLHADTSTLSPGKAYWATVEVTDSVVGTSAESNPYKFYSLPNIVLSGLEVVSSDSFGRGTTITTDTVQIAEHGLLVTTDPDWSSRPNKVVGNTVTGLEENTVYYYCPWVKDQFGRTYINYDDTDSVRTSYSVPTVKITETYTPTDTTFSGVVEVYSSVAVSSVVATCVSGGTTITTNLTAQTGWQNFTITGLSPFTKYHLTISATNSAGTGVSQTVYFTTLEEPETEIVIEVMNSKVSKVSNDIKTSSVARYSEKITIDNHTLYVFDNSEHSGEPVVRYDGGSDDFINNYWTGDNFEADRKYFVFSSVDWTDGDNNTGTEWSNYEMVHTYSLITVGTITTTTDTATFTFSVSGYSSDTEIEYSTNGESWTRVPVQNPQGETVTITDLSSDTTYYFRARVADSEREYSDYVTSTFTTQHQPETNIEITGFTEDGLGGVDVSISITQE